MRSHRPVIVGIDGRSGSGKSTLAERLGEQWAAPVVQLDRLCPGWHGLDRAVDLVSDWVLAPLRHGSAAVPVRWREWDWAKDRYGGWIEVPDSRLIIVEGCGIGSARSRRYLDALLWVEAPEPVRRSRALERELELAAAPDAESAVDPLWWWSLWASQETVVIERENTVRYATSVRREPPG
ncbi:hypothetical protein LWF01_04970 [Saxibacter everestensis]|uniref:(d)CMP kinase n=1 Tax=Saxibacter everestensis TaxID=2909229 RepID=A0ABY8QW11_9MICO|nr:hypothetical protein LWF01_04970 [Brevibacteriaceae bacterium ZFBP1038]